MTLLLIFITDVRFCTSVIFMFETIVFFQTT